VRVLVTMSVGFYASADQIEAAVSMTSPLRRSLLDVLRVAVPMHACVRPHEAAIRLRV